MNNIITNIVIAIVLIPFVIFSGRSLVQSSANEDDLGKYCRHAYDTSYLAKGMCIKDGMYFEAKSFSEYYGSEEYQAIEEKSAEKLENAIKSSQYDECVRDLSNGIGKFNKSWGTTYGQEDEPSTAFKELIDQCLENHN